LGPRHEGPARLFRRLSWFLLPLVLFWAGLEAGLSRVPNPFSVKRARCQALANEVDTIAVGSSNAFHAINPAYLSGCAFNLALPSEYYYYDYQISRVEMAELPHLRRIIVTVGYADLYWQTHESPEYWRQYYFRQEWGIPALRPEDRWNIKNWSRVALVSPESAFNALCQGFRKSRAAEVDGRGWSQWNPRGAPDDLLDAGAERTLALHHALMNPANYPRNLGYLEALITQAQARNIEVVLITLPVWDTFRARIRPEVWRQTRTSMEGLAARYHIRYLNFFQEPRLGINDFFDSYHLNPSGSIRFTRMLDAALGKS
jgi:hypothetical protein